MSKLRRIASGLGISVCLSTIVFVIHQANHVYRFGHLAAFGLHADVDISSETNLLGIPGAANVYHARLANYGALPVQITVCDYLNYASVHETMVAHAVQRWDRQSRGWKVVTEWDDSRFFCRPAFEVVETRLVQRWLWPGQSIPVGWIMPAERGGFRQGDAARFTIFLDANRYSTYAISTAAFRIDRDGEN
jgi:hypothetical protein